MPALISIPIRFIFKERFEQQYLAHLMGAGIVVFTMLISWSIKKNKKLLIFMGLLAAFGNIIWFLSSVGSSWYLGQVSTAFFISAAIFESLNKKRPMLVGIFLGAAFLSRLHTILSLPLFLYLFYNKKDWFINYFKIGLSLLPFILFNFFYNYLRFGTIFDQAYFLLPQILKETNSPWFKYGVFNFRYIPNNLKTMFSEMPKILKVFPFIQPNWNGLAIWITTPIFIYTLFAPIKIKIVKYLWISILLIMLVIISHGGNGFAQFGYRFAVDFYPLLFLILIKYFSKNKINKIHWILLIIGIIVNLWGVLWINKFGWVSF